NPIPRGTGCAFPCRENSCRTNITAQPAMRRPTATRKNKNASRPALAGTDERLTRRPMLVAMAVEAVVGPAVASADRGAPKRLAINRADDATGDRTDWACDHETDPRAGRGPDHVGLRARGRRGDRGESGCCQNKVTHRATPITRCERDCYHAKAFHKVDGR